MTKRVLKFGAYSFPDTQGKFNPDFTRFKNRVGQLTGSSGGFDEYGRSPAPTSEGKLTLNFWLLAKTAQDVTQMRDAVKAMGGWGVQKLTYQPADPYAPVRWCWARVDSIDMPEDAKCFELSQQVSVTFLVPDPRWYSQGTESATVWGGFTWGGATWGGTIAPPPVLWGSFTWGAGIWGGTTPPGTLCTGAAPTVLTLPHPGTADTLPRLKLTCKAGRTATNPLFERLDGHAQAVDTLLWQGTVQGDKLLDINARALSVRYNGADAFSALQYARPEWLVIPPGGCTLRVTLGSPTDETYLVVRYFDAWY